VFIGTAQTAAVPITLRCRQHSACGASLWLLLLLLLLHFLLLLLLLLPLQTCYCYKKCY
jgi:hypothetical protein